MKNEGRTPTADSGLKTSDSGLKALSPLEDNKPHILSEFLSAVSTPVVSIKQADVNNDNLSDILLSTTDAQIITLVQQPSSTYSKESPIYYSSVSVKTLADQPPNQESLTGLSKTESPAGDSAEFPAPVIIATEVMDLNKDGYNDIITAFAGTLNSPLQIQMGSQTGEFTDVSNLLPNLDATVLTKLKIADVNNDAFQDIILISIGRLNYEGDKILAEFSPRNYVLLNSGNGAFADGTTELFNEDFAYTRAIDIQVRDFGVDGLNDVFLINPDGNMLYTWSAETLTMQSSDASNFSNVPPSPVNNQSIQLDANGDGIEDTVVLQDGAPSIIYDSATLQKSSNFLTPELLNSVTSYISPYQYQITGPSGLSMATVTQIGDVVYLEFSSRVPAYVWGNILMTFDPAKLQCVSIEENPNNLYGSWVWWAVATGMPYYGGGGTYYYYDDTGLGSGWAKTWAHIDPGSGPTGTYDNIAGKIRIYTDTYSGYSYTSPLRIGFRVLQAGPAEFRVQSNDYMAYDWNNVDAGTTSTVNITEFGQSVYKEDVTNNVRISISGPVTAEIGQAYTIDTWGEIITPFRPIGTNVYSWELYIGGVLYQRRGFTYGEEHRRSWEFTGATEGAIVYKFRFRDGSKIHNGYSWVEVEMTVNVTPPGPHIDSITPIAVMPGDSLTITGSKFDTDPQKNSIFFQSQSKSISIHPLTATETQLSVMAPLSIGTGETIIWVSTNNGESNKVTVTILTVADLYQKIVNDLNTAISTYTGEIKKQLQSAQEFLTKSGKETDLQKKVDFVSKTLSAVMKAERACGDVEQIAYHLVNYRAALLNTELMTGVAYEIIAEMVRMKKAGNFEAYDVLYEALIFMEKIYAEFVKGDVPAMITKMKELTIKLQSAEGIGTVQTETPSTHQIQFHVAQGPVLSLSATKEEYDAGLEKANFIYASLGDEKFLQAHQAIISAADSADDSLEQGNYTQALDDAKNYYNGLTGGTAYNTNADGYCVSRDFGYVGYTPPAPAMNITEYSDNCEVIAFIANTGQGDFDQWMYGCEAFSVSSWGSQAETRVCLRSKALVEVVGVNIKWELKHEEPRQSEYIIEESFLERTAGPVTIYHLPVLKDGAKDIRDIITFTIEDQKHSNDQWLIKYKLIISKNEQGLYNHLIVPEETPGSGLTATELAGCGCNDKLQWYLNKGITQTSNFKGQAVIEETKAITNVYGEFSGTMIPANGPGILELQVGSDPDKADIICGAGGICDFFAKKPILQIDKPDLLQYDWQAPLNPVAETFVDGWYINKGVTKEVVFQTNEAGRMTVKIPADDLRSGNADDASVSGVKGFAYGIGVNLTYDNLMEKHEIIIGGFLPLNNDVIADADANTVLADLPTNAVPLQMQVLPVWLKEGIVTLKISKGMDKVRIWKSVAAVGGVMQYKLIAGGNDDKEEWNLLKARDTTDNPLPEVVYIESIGVSAQIRDVEIALVYENKNQKMGLQDFKWCDRIRFTIAYVDVDTAEVYEPIEETLGSYLKYNNDDDDHSEIIDREENTTTGDDDIIAYNLAYAPVINDGIVRLEIARPVITAAFLPAQPEYGGKIKVWSNAAKGTLLLPTANNELFVEWPAGSAEIPDVVYVEGYNISETAGDSGLRMSYTKTEAYPAEGTITNIKSTISDEVKNTVLLIDLDMDSDNNNGSGFPELSEKEDFTEENIFGKIFMVNCDDDDGDEQEDRDDNKINTTGANNDDFDDLMPVFVYQITTKNIPLEKQNFTISQNGTGKVRLFWQKNGNWVELLNPNKTETDSVWAEISAGDLFLLAELVEPGDVNLALIHHTPQEKDVNNIKGILIDIDIDVNRDGKTLEDDEENEDKLVEYTKKTGGLVLVNCDDDDNKSTANKAIRDMDDYIINDLAADILDFTELKISIVGLPNGMECFLKLEYSVAQPAAVSPAKKLRIFNEHFNPVLGEIPDPANPVQPKLIVRADITAIVKDGLEHNFWMEGLDFAENLKLIVECIDEEKVIVISQLSLSDVVEVLTTPIILIPNTQSVSMIKFGEQDKNKANMFYSEWDFAGETTLNFHNSINNALKGTGIIGFSVMADTKAFFLQDTCEFAFTRRICSNPDREVTLPVILKIASTVYNDWPEKNQMLKPDFGLFNAPTGGDFDHGGAVECLPPFDKNKYGLVMVSQLISDNLRNFFKKQKVQVNETQSLIEINMITDGSLVLTAHVDEEVCVVPFDDKYGFRILVADIALGLAEVGKVEPSKKWPGKNFETYGEIVNYYSNIRADFFDNANNVLNTNYDNLLKTLGNAPEVFIRIPVVLKRVTKHSYAHPDILNSQPVKINESIHLFSPAWAKQDPSQPDEEFGLPATFKNYVEAKLSNKKFKIHWVDVYDLTDSGGEAHCATNVVREPLSEK